jgi:hypothetical protein
MVPSDNNKQSDAYLQLLKAIVDDKGVRPAARQNGLSMEEQH